MSLNSTSRLICRRRSHGMRFRKGESSRLGIGRHVSVTTCGWPRLSRRYFVLADDEAQAYAQLTRGKPRADIRKRG